MPEGYVRFDGAEYLADKPDEQIALLTDCWKHPDPDVFLNALATIARARGISSIAQDVSMSRPDLRKALSRAGNPRYATLKNILDTMGVQVTFQASQQKSLMPTCVACACQSGFWRRKSGNFIKNALTGEKAAQEFEKSAKEKLVNHLLPGGHN